ncbi:MAG TPA: FRG domain-containing protein [Candidatus Pacearchaeota archaeon]|nr:FRG domain-containing protein [Candidatus Pacearchaeota archaeon]
MGKKINYEKRKEWFQSGIENGIIHIKCTGWSSFQSFMNEYIRDARDYIWRGQSRDDWVLIPSLDRKLNELNLLHDKEIRSKILKRFKFAMRGRGERSHSLLRFENNLWALGRHHGLLTPLLDWTSSPYIATYFAFEKKIKFPTDCRVIYGLSVKLVHQKSKSLTEKKNIKFISPLVDDIPRLIPQRGLFTRAPNGVDIESWVKNNISNKEKRWVLIKILIPNKSREMFLKSLDRMAISQLELFPDISGACQYCNLGLEIKDYCQRLTDSDIFTR